MFGSTGKKTLARNMGAVLRAFSASVAEDVGHCRDADTTIMFMGWVHYAIAIMVQRGMMKPTEITSILAKAAITVRFNSPNHDLGVSYLEVSQNRMFSAMAKAQGDLTWPSAYYDLAKGELRVDEAVFTAALLRETMAV